MNIEILPDQPAADSKAVSSLQLEFDRLRKTLEREQKQLRKFFTDMDRLCQAYADQVLPEMKNNHGMLKILLSRLIDLSTRKSLNQWHREELEDWIHELLDQLGQFDHFDARAAAELYSDLQQHHFGKRSQISDPDPFELFPDDEADDAPEPKSRATDSEAQQDFSVSTISRKTKSCTMAAVSRARRLPSRRSMTNGSSSYFAAPPKSCIRTGSRTPDAGQTRKSR
ncbi:hypothetical protein [Marinobacterium aestuariivivens]|uniref:Hemerythrin-like domain-containing protein n=1 Tax=Marinobacterium aestuariivivens TaxID=1698799 RepID=A0ABW2A9V3_9GAMM